MSRQFATSIDLMRNELLNAVVQVLAADPGTLVEGLIWFNSTDDMLRYYNGTDVIDIGSGGGLPLTGGTLTGDLLFDFTGTDAAAIVKDGSWDGSPALKVNQGFAGAGSNGGAELFSSGLILYDKTSGNPVRLEAVEVGGNLQFQIDTGGYTVNVADDIVLGATKHVTSAAVPSAGSHLTNKTYVDGAITGLIDAAPGALDTLNELAAALGDDPNFATTVTNALATKTGKYAATITGGSTSEVITHNLGTRDVVVSVHDVTTYDEVVVDVQKTTVNTITLGFSVAPAAGAYRVTVIG